MLKFTVNEDKYEIEYDENTDTITSVNRHGVKGWRDVTGDGLILALVQEIIDLKGIIKKEKPKAINVTELTSPLSYYHIGKDVVWEGIVVGWITKVSSNGFVILTRDVDVTKFLFERLKLMKLSGFTVEYKGLDRPSLTLSV